MYLVFGVDFGKEARDEAIIGHGVKDTRLGDQEDKNHRRSGCKGPHIRQDHEPLHVGQPDNRDQRVPFMQALVIGHADNDRAEGDVDDGANPECAQNTDGQADLRLPCLLCGSRDTVESNVGEEDC